MNRSLAFILILVGPLLGCQSLQTIPMIPNSHANRCFKTDWWELGRQEGAVGKPLQTFLEHQQLCADSENPPDVLLYTNGRNNGLIEYCTAMNGLEMGRTGQPYLSVCPEYLEGEFLPKYRIGRRIYEIGKENDRIELQIDSILRKITQNSSADHSDLWKAQLEDLQKARAQNEQKLNDLDRETSELSQL